jgi:hypothetical protein
MIHFLPLTYGAASLSRKPPGTMKHALRLETLSHTVSRDSVHTSIPRPPEDGRLQTGEVESRLGQACVAAATLRSVVRKAQGTPDPLDLCHLVNEPLVESGSQ